MKNILLILSVLFFSCSENTKPPLTPEEALEQVCECYQNAHDYELRVSHITPAKRQERFSECEQMADALLEELPERSLEKHKMMIKIEVCKREIIMQDSIR